MMIEDDIEFLGVSRPRVLHPSVNSVTGFTLHVEKNGNEPGTRMMFRKMSTNTVVVGRKGPGPSGVYESDDAKAMFRCPVVSRVHAKFTFSESGLLYLTDTSSHHGTYIRQPSYLTSKIIATETPVQVHHGDVITFGKSVGRNNEVVRPIVARVELTYNTPAPRTPTSIVRASSGRYGLRLGTTSPDNDSPSESSSEDNVDANVSPSSSSDHDSDIVEIPSFPKRTVRSMMLPASRPLLAAPTSPSIVCVNDANDEDLAVTMGNRGERLLASARRESQMALLRRIRYPSSSPTRKMSKSKSTSPMELATPSPPPSPAKIQLNDGNSSTSPDDNEIEDEGRRSLSPRVPNITALEMTTEGSVLSRFSPPLSQPADASMDVEISRHAEEEDATSAPLVSQPLSESSLGPLNTVEVEAGEQQEELVPDGVELLEPIDSGAAVECARMVMDEQVSDEVHLDDVSEAGDPSDEFDLSLSDPDLMESGLETASNPSPEGSPIASKLPVIYGVNGGISKLVDLRAALSSFRERLGTSLATAGTSGSSMVVTSPQVCPTSIAPEVYEMKLQEINEKLSSLNTTISTLQSQNRKRFNSTFASMNSKMSKLGALSSEISDTQGTLNGLKSDLISAQGDIDWVKTRVWDLRTDADGVRNDVDIVRSDVDLIRSDVDGVRSDIEEVRNDNDGIRMEVDGARNDIDFIRSDVDAARNDVDGVKDEFEVIHGDMSGVQADVGGIRSDVDGLRAELDDVRRDVDELMSGDGVKKEMCELKEEFDKLQKEWNECKEIVADARVQISNGNHQHAEETLKVMAEDSQIEEVNRRIGVLEEIMETLRLQDEQAEDRKNTYADELEALYKIQERSTTELLAIESARAQAESELIMIVAVRKDVEAQLLAAQAICSSNLAQSSLKRKRADDSGDFDVSEDVIMGNEDGTSGDVGPSAKPFVSSESLSISGGNRSTMVPNADGILVPSPKRARRAARARRIGTVVVQTATAISIGAVAAWTALAFS